MPWGYTGIFELENGGGLFGEPSFQSFTCVFPKLLPQPRNSIAKLPKLSGI